MSQKQKATFDLSLKSDQVAGEIALSNMPEIDVENRKATGSGHLQQRPRVFLPLSICSRRFARCHS